MYIIIKIGMDVHSTNYFMCNGGSQGTYLVTQRPDSHT